MPSPSNPRCELTYRRVPSGLNTGPVTSEPSWPANCRNGAAVRCLRVGEQDELDVVGVLGDVHVTGALVHRDVVGFVQRVAASRLRRR